MFIWTVLFPLYVHLREMWLNYAGIADQDLSPHASFDGISHSQDNSLLLNLKNPDISGSSLHLITKSIPDL